MPTKAISALDELTAPAVGDWIPIVDINDLTQGANGSTKKIAAGEFALLDLANTFTGAVTLSGTAGNQLVVDTSVLVVDATNNRVGVNNAGPSYSLDVTGTFAVTSTSIFSDNVTLANSKILFTDTVQARDSSGIQLFEDSGAGLTIADGGTATFSSDLIISGDLRLSGTADVPGSAAATGTLGDVRWDSGFIYVCTASNTWKRAAIATW